MRTISASGSIAAIRLRSGVLALLAVTFGVLFGVGTALAASVPTVTLLSSVCGATSGGTTVVITGTLFGSAGSQDSVMFGSQSATNVTVASNTSLTVTAPASTVGTVDITVITSGGTSATSTADQFTYAAGGLCAVQSVVPSCGAPGGGTDVHISGPGIAADDQVEFGGVPAASVAYTGAVRATPTKALQPAFLDATSPAGVGTVNVTVSDPTGQSVVNPGDQFTYVADGTTFGLCAASTALVDSGGTSYTLAGGHPASLTTDFSFNTAPEIDGAGEGPVQNIKDITAELPVGFVANLNAVAAVCTQQAFEASSSGCPPDSQVGYLTLADGLDGGIETAPVYDLAAPPGHLAEFGVKPLAAVSIPIAINILLDLNANYQVTATIPNITSAAPIVGTALTVFGATPGSTTPFLYFPPSCSSESSLTTTISADSWANPGVYTPTTAPTPGVTSTPGASTGCGLPFSPTITVTPTTTQADSSAGYGVDLNFAQDVNAAQSHSPVKNISVTLPLGTTINPALVDGVAVCNSTQFGLGNTSPAGCPAASAIGTVTATTPVIPGTLSGAVYLSPQDLSAPSSPAKFGIYVEAAGSGLDVKLAGTLTPNATTGQITADFQGLPPVPISDIKLEFNSGARAPLANSLSCGPATTTADLTPWSGPATADSQLSSTFTVDADGRGGACPASWPSAPGFSSGPTSSVAGGATGFTLTATRGDRQATLSSLSVTTPPGFTGLLKSVPLCDATDATAGSCPAASLVGTTSVGLGVGDDSGAGSPSSDQFYLSGQVFLTGPTNGDPFGLDIVVQPIAGPFDLSDPAGTPVIVRAGIAVASDTAQLTIGATLPTIQDGVLLHIRTLTVAVNRVGFGLNPTNCAAQSVTGTIAGASVTSPYQVGGCANLAFNPTLTATAPGLTSGNDGAGLGVAVSLPGANANLKTVGVTLPTVMSARLSTTQQACLQATFAANPASCPAASVIGSATATTPILPDELAGAVYEVSHGGAGLPSLDVVLSADGVTVVLDGSVSFTSTNATNSTFATIPDVPITSFNLNLPEGPHSALASTDVSLCGQQLEIATTLVSQSGRTILQQTPIVLTGCAAPEPPTAGLNAYAAAAHGSAVFVRVDLAKAGVLKISAGDIKAYSHTLSAGGHRIKLALSSTGKAARRRRGTANVKITFGTTSHTVRVKL